MSNNKKTKNNTTGHSWDGIEELDNKTPVWLTSLFIICTIIALFIAILYPSWPFLNSYWKGLEGYNHRTEIIKELESKSSITAKYMSKMDTLTPSEINKQPNLREFAIKKGNILFNNNCAACHGAGGQGNYGYPNLLDDDWLWGSSIYEIEKTIKYGIRSTTFPNQTRDSQMTQFNSDTLSTLDAKKIVNYVYSLSNKNHNLTSNELKEGKKLYDSNCSTCHLKQGKGNRIEGAPALNDKIWLYSGEKDDILKQIRNPKHGVMPAWKGILSDTDIKILSVYIYNISNSE